ncbi:MAG: hypothetical protein LBC29_00505, partial [Propionibacteriaceae bacterium]|nr:hypothetical protein [Propionibacteriaceae bacterium]
VFETVAEVTRFEWRGAYPVLKASVEGDPFRLAERLYYANGFESAASTVELDAVAAQNATGLLLRDLRDVFASQDAQDEQIAQDAQGSQPLPDAPAVSEA